MGVDRGNDRENAARDLSRQYGEHESAEDLIKAHEETFDVEMDKALNKPVDAKATAALDLDEIEPKYDDGVIRSAAVRGGRLVVVEETRGTLQKWSVPVNERPAARKAPEDVPPEDQDEPQKAPGNVTSETIQNKLAELQIDTSGKTKKDEFWALLPEAEQQALQAAADAA